ncbi:hypothetical protein Pelo_18851 [Pelomyxa schiedti]|nr:hypothetical protein Pelo_18851 [Pelomyxa schiedti]
MDTFGDTDCDSGLDISNASTFTVDIDARSQFIAFACGANVDRCGRSSPVSLLRASPTWILRRIGVLWVVRCTRVDGLTEPNQARLVLGLSPTLGVVWHQIAWEDGESNCTQFVCHLRDGNLLALSGNYLEIYNMRGNGFVRRFLCEVPRLVTFKSFQYNGKWLVLFHWAGSRRDKFILMVWKVMPNGVPRLPAISLHKQFIAMCYSEGCCSLAGVFKPQVLEFPYAGDEIFVTTEHPAQCIIGVDLEKSYSSSTLVISRKLRLNCIHADILRVTPEAIVVQGFSRKPDPQLTIHDVMFEKKYFSHNTNTGVTIGKLIPNTPNVLFPPGNFFWNLL